MVVFYLSFFTTILLGNKTFIEIGNLTHFSKYTLTIKACHKSLNESDWNALPYMAKASYDENHRARCFLNQSSVFLSAKKIFPTLTCIRNATEKFPLHMSKTCGNIYESPFSPNIDNIL